MCEEEKSTRAILTQVWASYVKDEFDRIHFFQAKAELSYVIAVMDSIGGWIVEERIEDWLTRRKSNVDVFKDSLKQRKDKSTWKLSGTRNNSMMYFISELSLVLHENTILGEKMRH